MALKNQTPFPALMFTSADPDKQEHKIVVMKVSYRIVRHGVDQWGLEQITDGSVPLCFADEYWGEIGESSVKVESDLAPFKPKCDVILNGSAYTPHSKEMTAIAVRLKMSIPKPLNELKKPAEPKPLNPTMPLTDSQKKQWINDLADYEKKLNEQKSNVKFTVVLEKTLSILGESFFNPNKLLLGWQRSSLKPFTFLPLRWEYAFGGHHCLYKNNDSSGQVIYNEACYTNPLGTGWVENGYFSACEDVNKYRKNQDRIKNYKKINAPRIEYHLQRQPKPAVVKQPKGKDLDAKGLVKISEQYPYVPAGFGFVGRSWSPRIALAGTYDEKWVEEQHPYPPHDIDYGYWNGAPKDQQIDFFYPNARIELWNLTKPEFANNGYLKFDFLGHRPFIKLFFKSGAMLPFPMLTDTVLIDTDNMTVSLTHKSWIRADTSPIDWVEAHFSNEAEGPLFILPEELEKKLKEMSHG